LRRKKLINLFLILICGGVRASDQLVTIPQKVADPAPAVIPFELLTRHILIKTRINNSEPLWFILDTGDKVAIVDIERAKSLGLNLQGEIRVGGAGPGTLKGSTVRDASLTVVGVEGNTQPVRDIVGRAPITLRQFVQDYRGAFA